MKNERPLALLGIDIGTSKTAAVIVEPNGAAIAAESAAHRAELGSAPGYAEQDPAMLCDSVRHVVAMLPPSARDRVAAVGITGQMHGVLLLDGDGEPAERLVTWQDGRCGGSGFLETLKERTGERLSTGFGCATLAWYAEKSLLPSRASAAATIHDWIAARICGLTRPVTDPTDAASWGLFDLAAMDWNRRALRAARIPEIIMPRVVGCGSIIGNVTAAASGLMGIPAGVPVAAALGDNQASLLATLKDPDRELALTLGTGGQLSAVLAGPGPGGLPSPDLGSSAQPPDSVRHRHEIRPYPGSRWLAVAASLCGGLAWQWLVETIEDWHRALGLPAVPREQLFVQLNTLGAAAPRSSTTGVSVRTHFLGERHDPALKASIEGIGLRNLTLGALARSLAEGICMNLRDMMPANLRQGRARLVGSGNALERNPLLRQVAAEVFGMPVEMSAPPEAAAVGAALNAASLCRG